MTPEQRASFEAHRIQALLAALDRAVRAQVARDGYEAVEAKLRPFIFDRAYQPVQRPRLVEWPEE